MTSSQTHFAAYAAGAIMAFLAIVFFTFNFAKAGAPPGLSATIATSSSPVLAPATATTLIATSSCLTRIIDTGSTTLKLTFTDKDTPSATFGVFQPASTTVVYDAAQYGCGQVKGYVMNGVSGMVTVMDSR